MLRNLHNVLYIATIALFAASCSDDFESPYQTLRADMVVMHADADKRVSEAITDEGNTLLLTQKTTAKWFTTPDSTYRTLLYYNLLEAVGDHSYNAEPLSMTQVLTLRQHTPKEAEKWSNKQDPVSVVGVWRPVATAWHKADYLNLAVNIKTGNADDRTQSFGCIRNSIADGVLRLTLCHDQNNVPQFFSQTTYLTIPLDNIDADTRVVITIPTAEGLMEYER